MKFAVSLKKTENLWRSETALMFVIILGFETVCVIAFALSFSAQQQWDAGILSGLLMVCLFIVILAYNLFVCVLNLECDWFGRKLLVLDAAKAFSSYNKQSSEDVDHFQYNTSSIVSQNLSQFLTGMDLGYYFF
eukprot:TRINITY_DN4383_c1_g1_i1.p1 TRINITY_DN4383_c1_g1~~TRINITY_DN4383_c1_g1_i1.p1  ORF type:complete len:134 (+),score=14.06 TRINITY_DN4383_c1_g1_i1:214-615(+)